MDESTDQPTDRPTDKAGCRVACTRLKSKQCDFSGGKETTIQVDGWMDGRTDDGWMDGQTILKRYEEAFNQASYTATPVTFRWAGAIFEITNAFGQKQ